MGVTACRPCQAGRDVALVLFAGCIVLGGLFALSVPGTHVYPPAPSSAWVQAYLIGGFALAAGLGIIAYVVLRGGRVGWRSLRRLGGVLAIGAMFLALNAAATAAYFGAGAVALVSLAVGVALVGLAAWLLGR